MEQVLYCVRCRPKYNLFCFNCINDKNLELLRELQVNEVQPQLYYRHVIDQ